MATPASINGWFYVATGRDPVKGRGKEEMALASFLFAFSSWFIGDNWPAIYATQTPETTTGNSHMVFFNLCPHHLPLRLFLLVRAEFLFASSC